MKKTVLRELIKTIVFLSLGIVLLLCIQRILSKKWYYPVNVVADNREEFYQLTGHADIQAVCLGTSLSEFGFDPMAVYEANNIVTFNLSSAEQPVPVSYFFCSEMFKRQNPQVVFFNASSLFSQTFKDSRYRLALDNMFPSKDKLALTMEYASHYPDEKQVGSILGAFLSVYRYHDRWPELSISDFNQPQKRNYYRKGNYASPCIEPYTSDIEWMNTEAEVTHRNAGWTRSIVAGISDETTDDSPFYEVVIAETNLAYLEAMKQLCDEHGAKLVLIVIPTVGDPQYLPNPWTHLRSNAIKELAAEYGLDYLDLLYDVDLGINWTKDTVDGGRHLNRWGAAKVSTFLADYLQNICGLTGTVCQDYEQDLPIYHTVHRVAELQMTEDLASYLNTLSQLDNITVFFSASDNMVDNLSQTDRQALRDFGLQTDFDAMVYSDAFLAVKENHDVLCEMSSNRRVFYEGTLSNGLAYSISSCGWLIGSESKVVINGRNYSLGQRGLNIVVLDNESGKVLDSVTFDTHDIPENQSASRDYAKTETYLHEYEQYLMIQDAKNGIGV